MCQNLWSSSVSLRPLSSPQDLSSDLSSGHVPMSSFIFSRIVSVATLSVSTLLAVFLIGCDPEMPPTQEEIQDAYISPPRIERADGFDIMTDLAVDLPGPLLNSVLPTRIPLAGGIEIRVIGADFRAPMYVRVGDQPCDELRIESSALMLCRAPAVESPVTLPVTIAWIEEGSAVDPSADEARDVIEGGARLLEDAVTYYAQLVVGEVTPSVGPASGSTEVTINGSGFSEPMDVRFGDQPARRVTVVSETELTALTPPSEPGIVDVSVRSAQELAVAERAFNFQAPLGIDEITPRWGSVSGGDSLELYGYGLLEGTQVSLGDAAARVERLDAPSRVRVVTPPSLRAGWVPALVENSNGAWSSERGFLYLDDEVGPFEVLGLTPRRLPADRGGRVLIGGNGFTEETSVLIDDAPLGCELLAPQRLSCFAPARRPGPAEVTVRRGLLSDTLTLTYVNQLDLYSLNPSRAAMSGGALIHARGRGFTEGSVFMAGDVIVPVERFESSEEVWLRAPPHPPAILDVTVTDEASEQQVYVPEALTYFDPLSRYGGSWGEAIEHTVNVTALNIYDFSPVSGVTAEVRGFNDPLGDPLVTGQTNERGQASLGLEGLTGPVHLTMLKSGFDIHTVERVSSENITVLMFPFTPPEMGDGTPPEPPEPVRISGTLTGLNDLPKPIEPGWIIRGFIDVSHRSLLNRSFTPPPEPLGVLSEDGPFEILASAGQMALIGTAAYVPLEIFERYERGEVSYWIMRQESRPIQIGMIRFLSLSPGAEISGLDLQLSHPLNSRADVRLLNPSSASGTPYTDSYGEVEIIRDNYQVRVFFDLGPDGYWELDVDGDAEVPQLELIGLPELSEWSDMPDLLWLARAEVHPAGVNSVAYHRQSELNRAVEIGPFVGAPRVTSHSRGDVIRAGDTIRWELWPGVTGAPVEPAQATLIRFYQAGLPVWSFTLPGGVRELTLPRSPSAPDVGLVEDFFFLTLETLITEVGLDYQDYNLLDLNNPSSYSNMQTELEYRE